MQICTWASLCFRERGIGGGIGMDAVWERLVVAAVSVVSVAF